VTGRRTRGNRRGARPPGEPVRGPRLLHEALYGIVEEVCWDADYLYRAFTEHFSGLMGQIYSRGGSDAGGSYAITGIKSGLGARIEWSLEHRLDFHGPNRLRLDYRIEGGTAGAAVREGSILVELGSGRVEQDGVTGP
jgi:hypothetical protein